MADTRATCRTGRPCNPLCQSDRGCSPSLESMESIAGALGVEIKDLFEFAHLQAGGVKVEEIEQLLASADEEKKMMIMKIVRAVVR